MQITAEMIQACRCKMQGVIVSDLNGDALARSAIHYDGCDELYYGSGDQILVLTVEDLIPPSDEFTDDDLAEDFSYRWSELSEAARDRWESAQ